MADKPQTIDAYLAGVTGDKRAALEALRETIHSIVPDAEEGISYGMPAFRLNGKPIAGFSASKDHCSYFPMSGAVVEAHADALSGYSTSKGTVRFQPDKPLPSDLVRLLIEARIAEMAGSGDGDDS